MSKQSTDKQRTQWEVDILLSIESIAAAMEQWMKEFQSGIPVGRSQTEDEFQKLTTSVANANEQWHRIFRLKDELFKIVVERSQGDQKIREEIRQRCREIWDGQEQWINNYHQAATAVNAADELLRSELQRMAAVVKMAHQQCETDIQLLILLFNKDPDEEKSNL